METYKTLFRVKDLWYCSRNGYFRIVHSIRVDNVNRKNPLIKWRSMDDFSSVASIQKYRPTEIGIYYNSLLFGHPIGVSRDINTFDSIHKLGPYLVFENDTKVTKVVYLSVDNTLYSVDRSTLFSGEPSFIGLPFKTVKSYLQNILYTTGSYYLLQTEKIDMEKII